jgi:hypothetical protein
MKRAPFLGLFLVSLAVTAWLAFACVGDEYSTTSDGGDDDTGDATGDDTAPPECPEDEGESATSASLFPVQPPAYYVEQSLKYFDTLDSYADPDSVPDYSELVARWEWPPWLKLTGLGANQMESIDRLLRLYPTSVPVRECQAFGTQPFGRCHVVFFYQDRPCAIYEEFTFNDQGEMTFIEAWSDLPGMLPSPDPGDYWAEGDGVRRLSTKVPGLGNETGRIDLDGVCMMRAAARDLDVADFVKRAKNPVAWWLREFLANLDSFANGCGWETDVSADCPRGR